MTKKQESKLTAKLTSILTKQGAFVVPIVGGFLQTNGLPDRHVTHPLWTGFIEIKVDNNKPDALQRWTIQSMNRRSRFSAVVCIIKNESFTELFIDDLMGTTITVDVKYLLTTLGVQSHGS